MPIARLLIALVLALGILGSTSSRVLALDDTVNVVLNAQGHAWGIFNKTLVQVDTLTGELTYPSKEEVRQTQLSEGVYTQFSTGRYPNMIRLTSANSPLVQGEIRRVFDVDNGSIVFVNENSELSVFNGQYWETILACSVRQHQHDCLQDAWYSERELRLITCSGISAVNLENSAVSNLLSVSTWSNTRPSFLARDTVVLKGDIQGWFSIATGGQSLNEDALKYFWIRTDPGAYPGVASRLRRSLSLWNTLCPDSEWSLGERPYLIDPSEYVPHELMEPLTGCSSYTVENVLDVAVDQAQTIYCATTHGVIVIPSESGQGSTLDNTDQRSPRLLVAPNPASHQITITLSESVEDEGRVLLLGADGRIWLEGQFTPPSMNIDVSSLAGGIYTLVLDAGGRRVSRSVFVLR